MKINVFYLSVILFFIGFFQSAAAQQSYQPIPMDPDLKYGILDNGLIFYIRHNDVVKERADFYIVQNVGAILEEDNQDGLAHFLEHMAFSGTKNFPGKQIINYLETVGVKFGSNINAYTSLDETVYNLTSVPTYRAGIVDTALMILRDWSGLILLNGENIDSERGIIREEWRTRATADRRLWNASLPLIYPNSQYAKRNIMGDTAIVNNFEYQTLRDFYQKWYRPDLQAIIVVGDINVDSVQNKVRTLFSAIPKRENPAPRPIFPLEDNEEPIVAILTDPEATTTRIRIDYRHRPMSDRMKASLPGYVISVANSLIENMFNNRLNEIAQRPDAPFAAAYGSYLELVKSKDAFTLLAIPNEGKETESLRAILTEGERMRRFGFTQGELARAKADLLSAIEKAYNERDKTKNNSYVQEYIRNFLDFEPIPGIEWEHATIQEILPVMTLEEINRIAEKYVSDTNQTVLITGPAKESVRLPAKETVLSLISEVKNAGLEPYVDTTPTRPLVEKTPEKGKIKSKKENKAQNVTEWTLSNGMRVILKPTGFKKDEILLYAYSEGGLSTVDNPEDLPSATISTSVVAKNGLGSFNQIELNKVMAGKIANLSPSIGSYEESLSGNSSVKDFETLMQLVYLYFTGVRQDDDAFNSLINQYRTLLVNASANPNTAFRDSIQVTVSGRNPRTKPFDLSQLEKVNQQKALEIFKSRFDNPANFTLFLIGNIDIKEMESLILTYLGGIPHKKSAGKWIDRDIRIPHGKIKNYFDKELKVEKSSNFIQYSGSMEFTLENRLAMNVIRDILNIRYIESLRSEESGTYGVRVQGSVAKIPVNEASLQMMFDTDPNIQERMLRLIHREIETILASGPQEQDLLKVKESLRSNFNENQTENSWWLNAIISYYKNGDDLTRDYLRTVESIDREMVRKKLEQLVGQGNVIEVVMSPDK
jgi:zinc protease